LDEKLAEDSLAGVETARMNIIEPGSTTDHSTHVVV